jgi:hypothetical protein
MKTGKQVQLDKFKQAAREAETDDSEARFEAALRKIGTAKPKSQDKPKKKKPRR